MTRISVIIPVYNRANLITRAVRSVLSQDFTDWEVIVVDDGSTDEIGEVMRHLMAEDSRVRFERLPVNSGVHKARNRGIELARGDILIFLDSDDELAPGALRKCAEVFKRLPSDVGVLYAWGKTDEGELTGLRREQEGLVTWEDLLCRKAFRPIKQCFGAVRRSCLGDQRWLAPGWDSIFWRYLQRRCGLYFLPQVLLFYHRSLTDSSLSVRRRRRSYKYRWAPEAAAALAQFLEDFGEELRCFCPRVYARYLWALAVNCLLSGKRYLGLISALKSFRYQPRWKAVLMVPLLLLPRSWVRTLYLLGED